MTDPPLGLADGLRLSRLSYAELWIRCLALGGSGTVDELRRHIKSDDCPDDHEHNIIAQALNDRYLEQGRDHPVGYRHLHRHPDL
ncbi:MAG TPA: hypothetical protein VH298_17280 [Jatrophihabitans sp.]|nr:hypothetical protein [Jatrophihabitans sp.]